MRSLVIILLSLAFMPGAARAALFTENFDDYAALAGNGWVEVNNSDSPASTYFQGNAGVFTSHEGADNSYVGVNFESTSGTAGTETISNWLILPSMMLEDGNIFSFYTRTVTGSPFPDRLEVRLSTNGTSTDVGTGPNDVGDFSTLLVSVNENLEQGGYPNTDWAQIQTTLSGLGAPVEGRLAFRYFVTNAGPNGANSNYIGIDTVSVVPEPGSALGLLGVCLGGCCLGRRRRR